MSTDTPRLSDHKALIFDVYGTLCDWETGIYNGLIPLLSRYSASKTWSRKEALTAFNSVETDLQAQNPDMLYSDLLSKVHEVLEQRLKALSGKESTTTTLEGDPATTLTASSNGASTSADATSSARAGSLTGGTGSPKSANAEKHQAFGNSIKDWPVFPDSSEALHRLAKHFKLVVLSNVDHASFRHTHALLSEGTSSPDIDIYSYPTSNPHKYWHPQETKGSKSPFSLVMTAQDTHCYKPALGGFKDALEYIKNESALLGGSGAEDVTSQVLSVAQSLPHDHEPANSLGMRSVWIDRQGAVTCNENPGGPSAPKKWTWRFETLREMADAVEKELASTR
ncbi:haloacid dehalogenase [Crucibulum laeve]|uniref:Haloacid dehalogenase n=1 Tax=Crucibulum laeve TaxID=68775 RepID=A0A5C3LZH2_9AGAR|nr:haloacid dehalogenase [Crucibulum laeve]